MPAAVLIGGLVAIAFAFAAIAAALLIENLVVSPLQGAAAAASEIAIVGGAIAWLLTQLVNLIRYSLAGVQALVGTAERQAADWWNYLVGQTVIAEFSYWWQQLAWLTSQEGNIAWLSANMPPLWSFVTHAVWPAVLNLWNTLNGVLGLLQYTVLPRLAGIGDDLVGLHHWLDGYLVPRVNGIGNDLAGLRDWVGHNAATHGEVASAEAQAIARAIAIGRAIEAEVTTIRDSPCMRYCSPLGDLGQLLQGLEDAGLLLIMLGLIEEARHNPQEVQSVLRNVFVPLVDDAANVVGLGR